MSRGAVPRVLLVVATLLAGGLSLPARADSDDADRYMRAAARLYENLEYERALEQLTKAKRVSRGPDDDATIALYEGIILADMGKRDDALAAFREGLLLKPDAQLPVRVSPKVEQDFESVRVQVKKELGPILAKQEEDRRRKAREDEERRRADERARAQNPNPGTTVTQQANPDRPLAVDLVPRSTHEDTSGSVTATETGSRPLAVPLILGGLAVAAVGVASYFGVMSHSDVQSAGTDVWQADANGHLQSAQGEALAANVLFVAGGVTAIAALIVYLAEGPSSPPSPAH